MEICSKYFGATNHLKSSQNKQKNITISFKSWLDQIIQYQMTQFLQTTRESVDKITTFELYGVSKGK